MGELKWDKKVGAGGDMQQRAQSGIEPRPQQLGLSLGTWGTCTTRWAIIWSFNIHHIKLSCGRNAKHTNYKTGVNLWPFDHSMSWSPDTDFMSIFTHYAYPKSDTSIGKLYVRNLQPGARDQLENEELMLYLTCKTEEKPSDKLFLCSWPRSNCCCWARIILISFQRHATSAFYQVWSCLYFRGKSRGIPASCVTTTVG